MHENSLKLMKSLLKQYAAPFVEKRLLDVGSQDINGTYREIVMGLGFRSYTGVDMQRGKNVDVVVPEDGEWLPVVREQFPVAISGQCLEHTRWPWEWIGQITELVERNGIMIVIAPQKWSTHRFPRDCWRVKPDGLQALFEWVGLKTLVVGLDNRDCYGVASKQLREDDACGD